MAAAAKKKPAKKTAPKKTTAKPAARKAPAPAKPARKKLGAASDALAIASVAPAGPQLPAERPSNAEPIETTLPIGSIYPSPLNPRKLFDDEKLELLAGNIHQVGLLQPILVRPRKAAEFFAGEQGQIEMFRPGPRNPDAEIWEIIAGERRWRAICKLVTRGDWPEHREVPVRIKFVDDRTLVTMAATENMARVDMHPLEEANNFLSMRKVGMVDKEIASLLGVSIRTVRRRTQLTRLCAEVQELFLKGDIDHQQASAFALGDDKAQRGYIKSLANQWATRPENILNAMRKSLIPLSEAFFDPALYTGEIISEEPEEGEDPSDCRYFADTAEFKRLQKEALEKKRDELLADGWKFVDLTREPTYRYPRAGKKGPTTGAVISTASDLTKVVIVTCVHPMEKQEQPQAQGVTRNANIDRRARALAGYTHELHDEVFRRAVIDHPQAALALAVVGLTQGLYLDEGEEKGLRVPGVDPERQAACLEIITSDELEESTVIDQLLDWPEAEVTALIRFLATHRARLERSYSNGAELLGPETIRLAERLELPRRLSEGWKPTAEFLELFEKSGLKMLCVGMGIATECWAALEPDALKALLLEVNPPAGFLPPILRIAPMPEIRAEMKRLDDAVGAALRELKKAGPKLPIGSADQVDLEEAIEARGKKAAAE